MTAFNSPITLDFDDGVDRKTLRRLRDRFVAINQVRKQRALSELLYRQQVVVELLPLIFHLNHPSLPGYTDRDCPSGLKHYEPDADTLAAARRLARSFAYRNQGRRRPSLEAMFLMGSPGTLGHAVDSDLDVWLCHQPGLSSSALHQLERKAELVSVWAADLGVELHVFIFSAQEWREGRPGAAVTGENAGSAQHYLLLDEFYRTAIHLGGCYPLWWLIPAEADKEYPKRARQLLEWRFIKGDEYIDFGALPEIPRGEFLGAGVWQLYKGIDSPWKAILKLLLIECYARDGERGLLAASFKAAVYQGETCPDQLDPYMMLYRRLEQWLLSIAAPQRLELVRRSFYLKAGFPLTRTETTVAPRWRGEMLRKLVAEWGWGPAELDALDNRQLWRVEDVIALRRAMGAELIHSYQWLSRLAHQHSERALINPEDLHLLGRKLYVAFQRKTGKIEQVNPNLVPSLAEENLAFHHDSVHAQGGNGWRLYRDLEKPDETFWHPVIHRATGLPELLLWCYCNGLLTRGTRLNVRGGDSGIATRDVQVLIETLHARLPLTSAPVSRELLLAPAHPVVIILLLNVGIDPQESMTERGLHRLSGRHDALDFSGTRQNLVVSVDQIMQNSWQEVSLLSYRTGEALIQCLQTLLAAVAKMPSYLPAVHVSCSNSGHGPAIARRVETLCKDILQQFFAGDNGPHNVRYLIEIDQRLFVLQFDGAEPRFTGFHQLAELMTSLCQPRNRYMPLVPDRFALRRHPDLRAVCAASQPGRVQLYFRREESEVLLWVEDERGALYGWRQPWYGRRLLVSLWRFVQRLLERHQLLGTSALLPAAEVYELLWHDGHWHPELKPEALSGEVDGQPVVHAVAVSSKAQTPSFDIHYGERVFYAAEHGSRVCAVAARCVREASGAHGVRWIEVSAIVLPENRASAGGAQGSGTARYLHYRHVLELALNVESSPGTQVYSGQQ